MNHIAVCVPVRNEAARLPGLLAALGRQRDVPGGGFTACFLFDSCTDDSRALVLAQAAALPFGLREATGIAGPPNAGLARGRALALGMAAIGTDGGLLLTTDADGVPADDWIARTCAALAIADAVAGRITRLPHPPSPIQDRIEAYYDRLYALRRQIDPLAWEAPFTHHCTGGANLGFRSDAYAAVGGFLPLRCGEDARIIDDASRLGLRVRRDAASVVWTSARRSGRIAGGLADALRQSDGLADARVADPADAVWQYRGQAEARQAFIDGRPADAAHALGLTADHVIGVARDCPNAEAFAMRVVPAAPGPRRMVPLDRAEAILAMLESARLDVVA